MAVGVKKKKKKTPEQGGGSRGQEEEEEDPGAGRSPMHAVSSTALRCPTALTFLHNPQGLGDCGEGPH